MAVNKKKKRKLVLYSGGQERSNHGIHQALVDLAGRKKLKSMAYIPFCEEGSGPYFGRFKRRYGAYGVSKFHCLPVDKKVDQKELRRVLASDIIYLAGGNTFYFLKHLRKSGLLKELRAFAQKGGVLAGLSAGAIIMTPNIEMAAFPPFDPDENAVALKNLKALDLVNFEFFPHYVNSKRNHEAMLMYSLVSKNPVFGAKDGSGIVIDGDQKTIFGEVHIFFRGRKVRLGYG